MTLVSGARALEVEACRKGAESGSGSGGEMSDTRRFGEPSVKFIGGRGKKGCPVPLYLGYYLTDQRTRSYPAIAVSALAGSVRSLKKQPSSASLSLSESLVRRLFLGLVLHLTGPERCFHDRATVNLGLLLVARRERDESFDAC
ncbi:hypothetical protein CDD81_4514 [Ophiocordyceps australis]|uniref:Uncharacterized protein n=1 Tax=Ophiocordyceps australis TaxID=1399860 RepID=A0A2C5XCB8_9HYPO|nr:hypothetical protein CDD81_4514 [Ophiocordyceps australis]